MSQSHNCCSDREIDSLCLVCVKTGLMDKKRVKMSHPIPRRVFNEGNKNLPIFFFKSAFFPHFSNWNLWYLRQQACNIHSCNLAFNFPL